MYDNPEMGARIITDDILAQRKPEKLDHESRNNLTNLPGPPSAELMKYDI